MLVIFLFSIEHNSLLKLQKQRMIVKKTTLKSQEIIIALLKEYKQIRAKLIKLLPGCVNKNFSDLKQIQQFCKTLPKSKERSRIKYSEVQLFKEVNVFLQKYLSKNEKGIKRVQFMILFQKAISILHSRLGSSIPTSLTAMENNPKLIKILYFMNELLYFKEEVGAWIKSKEQKTFIRNQNIHYTMIFQDANHNKLQNHSIDQTRPSTTNVSKNPSRYFQPKQNCKFDIQNDKVNTENQLFRVKTAKIQNQDIRVSTRCPSAANILRKKGHCQPIFSMKRIIKKNSTILRNSINNVQNKTDLNFKDSLANSKLSIFKDEKAQTINEKNEVLINDEKSQKRIKSISILSRSSAQRINIENNKKSRFFKRYLSTSLIQFSKDKTNSKYKIQQNFDAKSVNSEKIEFDIDDDLKGDFRKTNRKLTFNKSFKKLKGEEDGINFQQLKGSASSIQIVQELTYRPIKVSPSKKIRKSKIQQKPFISFLNSEDSIIQMKRKETFSRRNGLRSDRFQITEELKSFENPQLIKQKIQEKKKLDFNENVLLAMTNQFSSTLKKKATTNDEYLSKMNKNDFKQFYSELVEFNKQYSIGYKQSVFHQESTFFHHQDKIREKEDNQLQERVKQLRKNENSCTYVFEINTSETNRKDNLHEQFYRQYSFQNESDWIKANFQIDRLLEQKNK